MESSRKQYRPLAVDKPGVFPMLPPKVLNLSEVARYLHIHRSTAYRMVQHGELPGFKIGSDWRFNLEEIDNWRLGRSQAATAERSPYKTSRLEVATAKEPMVAARRS